MTYPHWTFRPCAIEHMKRLTHEYEHCRSSSTENNCNDIFKRANCIQWTNLDTEITYLDFLNRGSIKHPTAETDMTMVGMQFWNSIK